MHPALIVDDSRTAQPRLKSLLKKYELQIDVAFSAEEALGYLSYNQPDVIFMDHHMEGMDGLEALRIIKNNPTTAMIPVVMYTSEKGDVYMGQARALGALDILSKEIIKPANIERLLGNLKISQKKDLPIDDSPAPEKALTTYSPAAAVVPGQAKPEGQGPTLEEIRSQVARLFELHIADVRQQIAENSRFIVRNLRSEINRKNPPAPNKTETPAELLLPAEPVSHQPSTASILFGLVALTLLAVIGFELLQSRSELKQLRNDYGLMANSHRATQDALSWIGQSVKESQHAQQLSKDRFDDLMDAMSWALSIDLSFDADEAPLSVGQVAKIEELILRLSNAGFQGEIALDLHFGDLCLSETETGKWQLAEPSQPVAKCSLLSSLPVDHQAENYYSDAYIRLEQSMPTVVNKVIRLNLMSSGVDVNSNAELIGTAGRWNARALRNNRLLVELIPD